MFHFPHDQRSPRGLSADLGTPITFSVGFVFYWNLFYALALVIVMIAQGCFRGVGKAHDYLAQTKCHDPYIVLVSTSVINVVSDFMILVIPITAIWGLHMAREKKIKLGAIFAMGLL